MTSVTTEGVVGGRLAAEDYLRNFADLTPPLTRHEAFVESERCYFCYDAPCVQACPTSIDIPLFIRQIAKGNDIGAAETILSANIMGGMCARVCPTEQLCEEACVREHAEGKPVRIGSLQRHATDAIMAASRDTGHHPFVRQPESGRRIAVVGAGPAGLSCAHRLALLGHAVTLYDAKPKFGGLNEYGIAAYKTPGDFAQSEVDFILGVGGITVKPATTLGIDTDLATLRRDHDAVFLGLGLGGFNALPGMREHGHIVDAVAYIEMLRQAKDKAEVPVGRRVVVIGGGMTAIDAAVQSRRLGAEQVTIAYRRGPDHMKASRWEQELAQTNGVAIRHWTSPLGFEGRDGHVTAVRFEHRGPGGLGVPEEVSIPADLVLTAIGQTFVDAPLGEGTLTLDGGRLRVDAERRTTLPDVWAGGDCIAGGQDLTVSAVEDGKQAAHSIDRFVRGLAAPALAGSRMMADLSTNFLGIRSPNPFWLASAPPTDRKTNVLRAFKAGWGGVVWKTLGEDGPPVVNVSGPRYGAIHGPDRRLMGFNNIELITDRPLEVNLQEIAEVKRLYPDRALVASIMVPCDEESWKAILPRVEATGCDGVELNFGCPHGMSERGMGSAVGQVPEYIEMVARWCKAYTRLPVIVKLTPNITDIRHPARAAKRGGADAVSLINTINSIVAVDLDRMAPSPHVDGKGTHGGYCGPAVKPIALSMTSEIARDRETHGLPISAIGGITTWRDAAEFIALGAGTVQVCTAAMTYGFKVVEEMVTGLGTWMDAKGYRTIEDFRGMAVPNVTDWQYLNLNYIAKAKIDQDLCIKCGRCHIVCEDTSHQAITALVDGARKFVVKDEECVGCNLCVEVCPVESCITLVQQHGGLDPRTGMPYDQPYANWTTHPNNPASALKAAE